MYEDKYDEKYTIKRTIYKENVLLLLKKILLECKNKGVKNL